MKRNRTELEKEINYAITKMHEDYTIDQIKDEAAEALKDYFNKPRTIHILNRGVSLQTLSELDLYNIALFLRDKDKIDIDLQEYFTDTEISEAVIPRVIDIHEYDNGVILNDVLYSGDELNKQYTAILSYETIAKMHECNAFGYNFATQRRAITTECKNRYIREIAINMKSVSEIKKQVLNGAFQTNTITLNIRKTGMEKFNYDPKSKQLVIQKLDTNIDIIDGYHRANGIHQAWKENRKIEGSMIVNIKNLTVEEARSFIAQESLGTINNAEEVSLYDPKSNIAKLIKDINRDSSSNNILNGKISMGVEDRDCLIFYEIFSRNLKSSWGKILEDVSPIEMMEIKDFICTFYSIAYELIMRDRDVKTLEELKGDIVLNQTFLCGMLYAAKKMYSQNNSNIRLDEIKKMVKKLESENKKDKYIYKDEKDRHQVVPYEKAWSSII